MNYEYTIYHVKYNEKPAQILASMNESGWELASSYGDGRYHDQQDCGVHLIFRRLKD